MPPNNACITVITDFCSQLNSTCACFVPNEAIRRDPSWSKIWFTWFEYGVYGPSNLFMGSFNSIYRNLMDPFNSKVLYILSAEIQIYSEKYVSSIFEKLQDLGHKYFMQRVNSAKLTKTIIRHFWFCIPTASTHMHTYFLQATGL